MNLNRFLSWLIVASFLAAVPAMAQDSARPKKKKAKPVVEEEEAVEEEAAEEEEAPAPPKKKGNGKKAPAAAPAAEAAPTPVAFEKGLLEAYLKERTQRIKDMHKGQLKFIADEVETWNQFWNKLKDDRMLFEVRIARQRLDLFESLASLDPRDQAPSISDFEKLQSNVIRSFELSQKQKMQDFFLSRESRWKDFAAVQERDRQELVVDAESSWREQKVSSRGGGAGAVGEDEPKAKKKKKVKEAEEEEEESAAAEEKPRPRPKRAARVEDTFKFGPP